DFHVTGVQTCALPILVVTNYTAFNYDVRSDEIEYLITPEQKNAVSSFIIESSYFDNYHQQLWLGTVSNGVFVYAIKQKKLVKVRSEERRVGKECRTRR